MIGTSSARAHSDRAGHRPHVSGGHVNPAVTLGLAVTGRFPWRYVPAYLIAQIVGALLGALARRARQGLDHLKPTVVETMRWRNSCCSGRVCWRWAPAAKLLDDDAMSVSDDRQRRQPQAHGQPLIGRGNTVTDVAFSPDGRLLASTSADQTVRLWDVPTGTPHAPPLTGHTAAVEGMAFSPDGQLLATDGQDNTAGYGTSRQTQPRGRPSIRHSKSVGRVAFSSNNNLLASTSEDTSIQLWDVANGEPVGPALRAMKDRRGVWRSVPMTSCSAVWETIRSRACGANLLLACGWAN